MNFSRSSRTERLVQDGIAVKDDASKYHMHHKFALVDGKTLVNGSFNWTRQAVLNNRENVVISSNNQLVKAFKQEFEKMWDMY